jgi:hypothetical protein
VQFNNDGEEESELTPTIPVSGPSWTEEDVRGLQAFVDGLARDRMVEVMMGWDRGTLSVDFRLPLGPEGYHVRLREPTWIAGGTHVLETTDPELVLNWVIDLATHSISDKLYALREEGPPASTHRTQLDHEIREWERVATSAQNASSADRDAFAGAFWGFMQKNRDVVQIIREHYPEVQAAEEERPGRPGARLTEEQVEEIRRVVKDMNYEDLNRGYMQFNRWLSDQDWLGTIKTSVERTNTVVEEAYNAGSDLAGEATRQSLSRIPGWAVLKLTVESSADAISLLSDVGGGGEG